MTGNVKNGFTAEFVPIEVGIHMILVEYNGVAVGGTPYYSKAYDNDSVAVSDIPRSSAGKTVTFAGMFFWVYIFIFRPNSPLTGGPSVKRFIYKTFVFFIRI